MKFEIPQEILSVSETLEGAGFEAYLVGGCVRDILIGRTPKDWDFTTNATPEQIQSLFTETFYENVYGTVGIVLESENPTLKVVEVTPYRKEGAYSDARRPDSVEFGVSLKDDLERRDFTVNAIAYRAKTKEMVDLHGGQEDIKKRLIRAVGTAKVRFDEDALRMMRGVRLSAELGFAIEQETAEAIHASSSQLAKISKERIRDELVRILNTKEPMQAIFLSHKLGLLTYIAPDIEKGIGIGQNQAHSFDVFEHLLRAMQHAADKDWDFIIRLSALFHDVAKPETRRWSDEKKDWTFHGHEVVGARIVRRALRELKFSNEVIEKVVKLVRWHMFFSDPDKITLSAVRRMIANVGEENIWDLLNLRICDRIGTGRPKEQPFRFRKYKSMVDEALRDPISVIMLKVNGEVLMKELQEAPGPRIGWMLLALLEEVLEDPGKNTEEYLLEKARVLSLMEDGALRQMGEEAKKTKEEAEEVEIASIRAKHHVD